MKKLSFFLILLPFFAQGQIITTVAGVDSFGYNGDSISIDTALLYTPYGVASGRFKSFYIADNSNFEIRKVDSSGLITKIAGGGSGYNGDGGLAIYAEMGEPYGVIIDRYNNVFFADFGNNVIRKIDTFGIITTVAGNGTMGYSGDWGVATAAQLHSPTGVTVDKSGNLYIADYWNSVIRMVDTYGIITTVAGNGTSGYSGDGSYATAAKLYGPNGVSVDCNGDLLIADTYNNAIRKVNADGIITTIAGNGTGGYSGNGGSAVIAELHHPTSVISDGNCNTFIADYSNNVIRKVDTAGIITTIAGDGVSGFSGDGGLATAADFFGPVSISFDVYGSLLVADAWNNRIRKVTNIGTLDVKKSCLPEKNVTLYPNPTQQEITVYCSDKITSLMIMNVLGQLVYSNKYSSTQVQIDVSILPSGIYFLQVNDEALKFIKE